MADDEDARSNECGISKRPQVVCDFYIAMNLDKCKDLCFKRYFPPLVGGGWSGAGHVAHFRLLRLH